jgi:hypothetical protein
MILTCTVHVLSMEGTYVVYINTYEAVRIADVSGRLARGYGCQQFCVIAGASPWDSNIHHYVVIRKSLGGLVEPTQDLQLGCLLRVWHPQECLDNVYRSSIGIIWIPVMAWI